MRYSGTNPARRRDVSEGETRQRKKPEKRKVGRSLVNRSHLEGLRRAWAEKDLVLFLGAGV